MGILSNVKELGEWMNYQKRDSIISAKIIKKQLKQEKDRVEYYRFKKSLFEKLDEVLYSGDYSRVILRPVRGFEYAYELVTEDEEFNMFYEWRFTSGGELEVSMKKIEL